METEFTLGPEAPIFSQPYGASHPGAEVATVAKIFWATSRPCGPLAGCLNWVKSALGNNSGFPWLSGFSPQHRSWASTISAAAVAAGNKVIEALGLKNIVLTQHSCSDLPENLGLVSYVIAHGVFSSATFQAKAGHGLWRLASGALEPLGLACVSYNVFPGWHMHDESGKC